MRGIRGEPVEVWMSGGRPVRFGWRGRVYTVLFVRERRYEPRQREGEQREGEQREREQREREQREREQPAPGTAPGVDDRDCWIVEATPQRNVAASTFELCHELDADRWWLSRA